MRYTRPVNVIKSNTNNSDMWLTLGCLVLAISVSGWFLVAALFFMFLD